MTRGKERQPCAASQVSDATLEVLEHDVWPAPNHDSHLVCTCHALRKKPIGEFSVEDLRIMIGQRIGLRHLGPRALDVLEENPWAEGDFYPGDLLNSLARDAEEFLLTQPQLFERAKQIVRTAIASTSADCRPTPAICSFAQKHCS